MNNVINIIHDELIKRDEINERENKNMVDKKIEELKGRITNDDDKAVVDIIIGMYEDRLENLIKKISDLRNLVDYYNEAIDYELDADDAKNIYKNIIESLVN